MLLTTLVRACKLQNGCVRTRLPVGKSLLEILLFKLYRCYDGRQTYLRIMYQTIFSLAYYGLLRVGELTQGTHTVRAKNIHIGENKDKIMLVLYSSKTHGREPKPQKVTIQAAPRLDTAQKYSACNRHFCPFALTRTYLSLRGGYDTDLEQFFVFRDCSPVKPTHVRKILKETLSAIGLESFLYGFHSFRIGRASDMLLKI